MKLAKQVMQVCEAYDNKHPTDFVQSSNGRWSEATDAEIEAETKITKEVDYFSVRLQTEEDEASPLSFGSAKFSNFVGLAPDKKAAKALVKKYFPKAKKMYIRHHGEEQREYEAHVAEVAAKKAAKQQEKESITLKERQALKTTIVGKAVEPFRLKAEAFAEQSAKEVVANWKEKLVAAGNSISRLIPPSAAQIEKHKKGYTSALTAAPEMTPFVLSLMDRKSDDWHEPDFDVLVWSDKKEKDYIKGRIAESASQYYSYVEKLVYKLGQVTSAVLTSGDVWHESFLIIEKPDGTKEHWKTKQIFNTSKLGNMFLQWPTRLIKRVDKHDTSVDTSDSEEV